MPFPPQENGEPRRRLEAAATPLGARLAIVGGYASAFTEGLEITDEVLLYNPLLDEWDVSRPRAPVRWTHAALAGIAGSLYLLGGHDSPNADARGEAFVLAADRDAWEALPAMPPGEERGAAGVIVSPPFIYLFGGANRSGPLATNLRFDVTTRTWERVFPDLPTPRSHPAVMERDDGTIVVAGGLDGANRPLGDVYVLPPDDVTPPEDQIWKLGAAMPTPRGGCAYGAIYGSLVCAGGEAGAAVLDVVERYDFDGDVAGDGTARDAWFPLPAMPEPRGGAQGAVVAGQLFVTGGARARELVPVDSLLALRYTDALGAGAPEPAE